MTTLHRRWAAVAALSLALIAGCARDPAAADVEVARVASPDARADAVLTEANPGATASFVYRIRVVAHGADWRAAPALAELHGATRNASAYGVDLRWQGADTLYADYLKARLVIAHKPTAAIAGRTVAVRLRAGVANPAAAAGGMAPRTP
ncbi:hypothetical protein [Lysobacter firmicutimachus]|uniref:DUF1425 domain-containing protein n=1 Tax=Lysobacter firmicutimachus TaxID=1792846 RepID=A0ABU8CYH6_9GAMM